MREIRFDDAYLYKYSERDGTPATRMPREQFVADDVAQSRLERLIELHRRFNGRSPKPRSGESRRFWSRRRRSEAGLQGRTDSNKVVSFAGPNELIGRFATVRLTATSGSTFRGELVTSPAQVQQVA
jgi:tRNA-2-methylthio-N6-dimethylallyladenosine synthase